MTKAKFVVVGGDLDNKGKITGGGLISKHKTYDEAHREATRLKSLKHPNMGWFDVPMHCNVQVMTAEWFSRG